MNDDNMKYDFLRMERDKLLRLSDKYLLPDYPHTTDTIRNEWITYRQNLRDLPSAINISDVELNFDNINPIVGITWPTPPS